MVLIGAMTLSACGGDAAADKADVQAARDALLLTITEVTGDFWVPAEGRHETTITWVSDDTDHIVVTDETAEGKTKLSVTRPDFDAEDVWVTLTATITKNKESLSRSFDIKVLREPGEDMMVENIAAVYGVDHREPVGVIGIVSNIVSHRSLYIEDDSGGIAIYDFNQDLIGTAQVGDRVRVIGERDSFSGLIQIGFLSSVTILESGVALPAMANLDNVDIASSTDMLPYQGRRVELNDMVVTTPLPDGATSSSSYNITLTRSSDDKTITFRFDHRIAGASDLFDAIAELEKDDVINVTGMTVGWYEGPQLVIGHADQFELVE